MISWAAQTFAAVEVESVGGRAPRAEDQPDADRRRPSAGWLGRHALTRPSAVAS